MGFRTESQSIDELYQELTYARLSDTSRCQQSPSAHTHHLRSRWRLATFRGADRSGIASDTGLLTQWPEAGPELLWKTNGLGRGYSSPAISNGKIYTMGDGLSTVQDSDEYLICLDQKDGSELWRSKLGPAWTKGQPSWQSSRSTPTIDGDSVYALTADGVLINYPLATVAIMEKS